jgi:23S rRNA (adenine2503-C2)-methyltransferase
VNKQPRAAPREAAPSAARTNLYGLDREGLASALLPLTARRFHADQIYHWMYGRQATSFEVMTDLPASLRRDLQARHRIAWPEARVAGRSADGSVKYVLRLEDGREIEAVHIVYGERITFCLSSQVGCALRCAFCLTGTMGLLRNLAPGEIVGQVSARARAGAIDPRRVRIVFMGMGEPLHNYDAVLAAFRILADPQGFGIPPRRVTVSTVGLVPGIERLARETPRPRLAVSLSASTGAVRDRLVPINRRHDLASLMRACRAFPLRPRERITFEYILLEGINDGPRDPDRVARLLHGVRAKVNVIPYNDTGIEGFRTPAAPVAERFRDALLARGIPASIRWSKGRDIGAACGQLARGPGRREGKDAAPSLTS